MSRSGVPDGSAAVYVALGDSISIDEYAGGNGRGAASLLARNRDADFPEWQGSDLQTHLGALDWHLLATDGGTTATLLAYQLPRLERLGVEPTVVTLTVGGNDVLSCYGDTRGAMATIAAVGHRVGEVLERVTALAPAGNVVVGNVYDPSDGTGDASRVGLPAWPDVVDVLAALNATLAEVSSAHGAAVADIHGRFLGHGLARGNPAQGNARPADRELWYCNVIEPNAWGASAARAAFWEALGQQTPA